MVLAKIVEMPEHGRTTGKPLHAIIKASASPLAETLGRICRLTTEPAQSINGK